MQVQQLPTTIVSSTFDLVRRPIAAVGDRVAADDVESWGPLLGLDEIEASLKIAVGSVLHDQCMLESGRAARVRVTRLREAARTEALADEIAERAEASLDQTLDDVEQRRAEAELEAET